MTLKVIDGGGNSTMTSNDRMFAYILARIQVIEAAIAFTITTSENHELIKDSVCKNIVTYEKILSETAKDEEIAHTRKGLRESFHSIFCEYPLGITDGAP